jgi:hypothetical protein
MSFFGVVQVLFFRLFSPQWWKRRWLRRASWLLPAAGLLTVLAWGTGEWYAVDWLAYPGALLTVLLFVLEVALFLSLPITGIIHFVNWGLDKIAGRKHKEVQSEVSDKRRRFLRAAAAAVPMAALTAGGTGVVGSFREVKVHLLPMYFRDLPSGLDGMRLLHISDLHLRHYVTLDDLSQLVENAEPFKPDLTLVIGDISDDLSILLDSLKLIDQLHPPMGTFASLGNHEYYRGIGEVLRIFKSSPFPLMVDKGVHLNRGGSPLYLAAIDDPRAVGGDHRQFFVNRIDKALGDQNGDDFTVLMSHRPDAFDHAAARDIPLTLSGHTHGGQIGVGGRSVFDPIWPNRYLWGEYRKNESQLYTSSGAGHWFPFRLGCPTEAPVIELRRGDFPS